MLRVGTRSNGWFGEGGLLNWRQVFQVYRYRKMEAIR